MTAEDIFLGSQASLTLVPEVDLYIPINHNNSTYTSLEAHDDWEAHFLMVNNLYVGCIVEFYDADVTDGTTTVQSTHVVTSNTHNTIVISLSSYLLFYLLLDAEGGYKTGDHRPRVAIDSKEGSMKL